MSTGITTDYASNFVYENNILQFFNQPEGYVELNGSGFNYVYQYKDHLGNIRLSYKDVSLTSTPSLQIVEENNYYPFGLKHKGYNNVQVGRDHKFGFGNKEEQDELGLGWIDITARNYDAALGRWMNVDPLATKAPSWTPYRAFFNNPIRYIDPTGLFEDDYGLNKQGNVSLLRKTDDPTDKLIALDNDGNETDKSIEVDKGILDNRKTNTVTASNGKDYTFDQYKIKSDDKASVLFEFVSNNTEVEWSPTGVGAKSGSDGQNILTTSHIKDSEIGGGYLKAYGYAMRKHSHSHPYNKFPSVADKNFAESLNLKFPKATLDIYHKGEYFRYDKDGLISIPSITLPEIEIKVSKN